MNEILKFPPFRAKSRMLNDNPLNPFYDVELVLKEDGYWFVFNKGNRLYQSGERVLIERFTGVVIDEVGIYEGDRCNAIFKNKRGESLQLTGDIIMDEYMWCIKCNDMEDEDYGNTFSLNRVDIIEVV